MSVKNGDFVINYCSSEFNLTIGKVTNLEDKEHDIEFFNGGTVSPVGTEDSIVIPENLAILLDKILDSVPVDADGCFILKENNLRLL